MRCGLSVFLLLFACNDAAEPTTTLTPEPAAETAPVEIPGANGQPELPTEPADENSPDENAAEGAGSEAGPENETDLAPEETLLDAPRPDARVELTGRINHAGILRLTRALGLPAPLHVHGRPLAVPNGEQVISLVSFLSPGDPNARLGDMRVDRMHTEAWLLDGADGSLFRVSAPGSRISRYRVTTRSPSAPKASETPSVSKPRTSKTSMRTERWNTNWSPSSPMRSCVAWAH